MLKRFFSSKKPALPDFSAVKVDMHSHLIPGIDDGARTMEDTIELIRGMYDLGFVKFITTPHIQGEFFKNTPEIIYDGLARVRESVASANIPVELEAAAEYLLDDAFEEKMKAGNLMAFSGKYLLVEMSYYSPNPDLKNIIFNLQVEGFKVILAHPERYSYWFNDFSRYEDLKDRGVYFQLNTVSLAGHYPEPVKKTAEKLIGKGMIDFIGSDMHNMNYMRSLEKSLREKSLARLMATGKLMNDLL